MKALFGVLSLLVVLAVVGLLAARQLRPAVPVVPAAVADVPASAPPVAGLTAAEQARQIQDQVRDDLNHALEQGARRADPDQ